MTTAKDYFDNFESLPDTLEHGEFILSTGNMCRWVKTGEDDDGLGVITTWITEPTNDEIQELVIKLSGSPSEATSWKVIGSSDAVDMTPVKNAAMSGFKGQLTDDVPMMRKPSGLQ